MPVDCLSGLFVLCRGPVAGLLRVSHACRGPVVCLPIVLGRRGEKKERDALVKAPGTSRRGSSDKAGTKHLGEALGREESWFTKESGGSDVEVECRDPKIHSNFRVPFLRKLECEKVWVPAPQRPPKHQTVIIFDWDDTLLCTSFLSQVMIDCRISPNVERRLELHALSVKHLLQMAMDLGHVFIITNAVNGWVQHSAKTFMPSLLPTLQKLPIISARGSYETQYPSDVGMWKIQAFLEVQRQLDSEIVTNLISLGDSELELDAAIIMRKEFTEAVVKTIKFQENPGLDQLSLEVKLVLQNFKRIVEGAGNLTITLEQRSRFLVQQENA